MKFIWCTKCCFNRRLVIPNSTSICFFNWFQAWRRLQKCATRGQFGLAATQALDATHCASTSSTPVAFATWSTGVFVASVQWSKQYRHRETSLAASGKQRTTPEIWWAGRWERSSDWVMPDIVSHHIRNKIKTFGSLLCTYVIQISGNKERLMRSCWRRSFS